MYLMKNKMKKTNKKFPIYVFSILAFLFAFTPLEIQAQSQTDTKKQIKYKKARALQGSTAKKWQKFTKL